LGAENLAVYSMLVLRNLAI